MYVMVVTYSSPNLATLVVGNPQLLHTVDSLKIAGLKFHVFQFDAICVGLKFMHFAVENNYNKYNQNMVPC